MTDGRITGFSLQDVEAQRSGSSGTLVWICWIQQANTWRTTQSLWSDFPHTSSGKDRLMETLSSLKDKVCDNEV